MEVAADPQKHIFEIDYEYFIALNFRIFDYEYFISLRLEK